MRTPMVAFKQPQNFQKMLCHAKLPHKKTGREHPKRDLWGMKKCNKPCPIDIHVLPSKTVKSSQTGKKFVIKGNFNCFTE